MPRDESDAARFVDQSESRMALLERLSGMQMDLEWNAQSADLPPAS
jgi:hypothetical protein